MADLNTRISDFLWKNLNDRRITAEPDVFWASLRDTGTEIWLDTGDMDEAVANWTAEMSALTTNNTLLNNEIQKGIYDVFIYDAKLLLRDLPLEEKVKEIEHLWTLRDSMALFPFSLRDVTKNFNVEHKKGDFDHSKINWKNWEKLRPEWSPYLKDDCRGLLESLEAFEQYIIKNFSVNLNKNITLAQMCMNIFRTNYLKYPIPCYRAIEDDIRASYFGGRTEIFKIYGKNLKYYDVTSLYPTVMHNKFFPVGKPVKVAGMSIADFGVCKVTVKAPDDLDIPLLPYRMPKTGKLLFPKGEWTGFYCTPELQKAKSLGYEITVHYGYKFKPAKLFVEYVDEMFKLKNNSAKNSVDYTVSKLLMNSLYGKFGQRRERQQMVIFPESTIGLEPIDFFGDLPVYVKKVKHSFLLSADTGILYITSLILFSLKSHPRVPG